MELLRSAVSEENKKSSRWSSMENHLTTLATAVATETALQAEVSAFDTILDGLTQGEKDSLNASAFVVAARALYVAKIANSNGQVVGIRGSISGINALVQADGDYSVAEKAEFAAAKTNEV